MSGSPAISLLLDWVVYTLLNLFVVRFKLLVCLTEHDSCHPGSVVELLKVFESSHILPNTANIFSPCRLNLVPLNARLMSLPVERISQHVPATLVMPRLVKDKVCASQHSVTPVFHFFLYSSYQPNFDRRIHRKGQVFLPIPEQSTQYIPQRMSELGERFGPLVVKVDMLFSLRTPWFP